MRQRMPVTMTICAALALPASAAARLSGPALEAPAASAYVQALGAFTWKPVRRAARYELQVSADKAFGSTLLSLKTTNTAGTLLKTLQDGTYYWRVRAVSAADNAGAWSKTRTVVKNWTQAPQLLGPGVINWPNEPGALQWPAVPGAVTYLVSVGTDDAFSKLVVGAGNKPIETEATSFVLPTALPLGKYYWSVTPVDAQGFKGEPATAGSFRWSWNAGTAITVNDLNDAREAVDPMLSWSAVPGAARYELEINPAGDFAPGSKICCSDVITGTSYAPVKVLPNNTYYSRVRAIGPSGDAGPWSATQSFSKTFDSADPPANVSPSISDLRVEDNTGALVTGGSTPNPVVRWTPVPGASGYEVRGYPWNGSTCNFGVVAWDNKTETSAWTPLEPGGAPHIGSAAWPTPSSQLGAVTRGSSYCIQVRAYTDRDVKGQDVIGAATELAPGFTYAAAPAEGPSTETQDSDYLSMQNGSVATRMPLFTWKPVTNARRYFVVVARDREFTKVIDVARTSATAYAPRRTLGPISYTDETTSYYWAVVPEGTDGVTTLPPNQDHPQSFDKSSVPPSLTSPGEGATVPVQPTFRWGPAEGARNYRLQVATDTNFGDLLEDVTTASTAYTTVKAYPADTTLYWRVRANDEMTTGLNWSSTGSFTRTLPAPTPSADNATAGTTPPLWSWAPISGAIGYEIHVDQGDGTQSDLPTAVPAFSALSAKGVGVIHWKVRARFPSASGPVVGAYSDGRSFIRSIPAPTGAKGTRSGGRLLLSWKPVEGAKNYRVEVSPTSGFTRVADRVTTDLTTWAPDTSRPLYVAGGRLYWRISALDARGAAGAAATGSFTLPRSLVVTTAGRLRHGRRGSLTVTVRGVGNKAMRRVGVRVSGAGVARKTKRTGRKGTATFSVRPTRRGSVVIRAAAKGYRAAAVRVAVR